MCVLFVATISSVAYSHSAVAALIELEMISAPICKPVQQPVHLALETQQR